MKEISLIFFFLNIFQTELQSWDSWGLDESQGRNRVKQESPQPEPEIDFFQGMTPTIKKTTKVTKTFFFFNFKALLLL